MCPGYQKICCPRLVPDLSVELADGGVSVRLSGVLVPGWTGLSTDALFMTNDDIDEAKTTADAFAQARLDGADRQRRRFGYEPLATDGVSRQASNLASQDDAIVLQFPSLNRTLVRSTATGEEAPCTPDTTVGTAGGLGASTGTDVNPASPPSAGASCPRSTVRSPKRVTRGTNPIGVIVPALKLPKELSGYRPQDVGLVTHATVAILAPALPILNRDELAERVMDVAGGLLSGGNHSRRRVLMLTAAGHAATYLRRFAPNEPWELLGCEFDTGSGVTDLAWRHVGTNVVFFDELKTHNRPQQRIASRVMTQIKKQSAGGQNQFGTRFAGVRLVPLGSLHLVSLVRHDRKRVLLAPTPDEPLRRALPSPTVSGGLS